MRLLPLVTLLGAALVGNLSGQGKPPNGPRPVDPRWTALVGARVIVEPGKILERATVVMRNGRIVAVDTVAPPAGAKVRDVSGLTLYPAFVESYAPVSVTKAAPGSPGAHWHDRVQAQRSALDGPGLSHTQRKELRKLGFAAAAITPSDGIFRGQAAVTLLRDDDNDNQTREPGAHVVSRRAYHSLAFEYGGRQQPPSSQMGAIAIIRQTLMDSRWHGLRLRVAANEGTTTAPTNRALEVLDRDDKLPLLFATRDEQEGLRATVLAKEAGRPCIVLGCGYEFRRAAAFRKIATPLIVPLQFPEAPDVSSIEAAASQSLRAMWTWEQAPTNPGRLLRHGVTVALTSHGLKKKADFHKNLRRSLKHGLTKDQALAMLTTTPARLLGAGDRLGRIAKGQLANLLVVEGNLFDKSGRILDVYVAGQRHRVTTAASRLRGHWQVTSASKVLGTLHVASKGGKLSMSLQVGDKKTKAQNVQHHENRVSFHLDGKLFGATGTRRFSGLREGNAIYGRYQDAGKTPSSWQALRQTTAKPPTSKPSKSQLSKSTASKADQPVVADSTRELPLPFGAFGRTKLPEQQALAITGATLWTCDRQGNIDNGVLLVRDGKVVFAGSREDAPALNGYAHIDAKGKHITPGLIDCHSHTGIRRGINESGQAVTAEVRIQDVLNGDDVNFYRQLAGGVTCVNQLHGSANPIGGQNHVIKLRWGVTNPDQMRVAKAPKGIKFALGENVKQSNWGDRFKTRYPQTRMGVETLIRDRFTAAQDYIKAKQRYRGGLLLSSSRSPELRIPPVRIDLELEALAEILQGKRFIHCHSYRQDEILMLCRVARDFGFTIGTFQHVLEGYKVADAIKGAARGGSAFSDWWAYKIEVFDAIPYNGAIMHNVGVVVSFNSDSNELARHLNTEAAKAVKYGGLQPVEALKFVTLNPAIQLGIDKQTGSLRKGKDADFVIWSGDPLSHYSRCLATYVDGRAQFSVEEDQQLRQAALAERDRLTQVLLQVKRPPANDKPDKPVGEEIDWRSAAYRRYLLRQIRSRNRDACNCLDDVADMENQR